MSRQPQSSRKRSASAMSLSDSQDTQICHLPRNTINPLSHTPSVLLQLQLAGLSETEQLPSRSQPKFPHRAWHDQDAPTRRGAAIDAFMKPLESDVDGQAEDGLNAEGRRRARKKEGEKRAKYGAEKEPFRPLARAIYGFLDKGDVANAKRAFGILARSHVHGKPLDIRRNHYWALGAEILMREGSSAGAGGAEQGREADTWPAENIMRVREYFQDLIQRYPYNFKYHNAISAVNFWPALLNYELFQLHTQQMASLRRLEREAEEWEDDSWQEPSSDNSDGGGTGGGNNLEVGDGVKFKAQIAGRDRRLRQAKDQIRLRTLDALREMASRMDELLEDRPYSNSHELLRLRGMASLYIGDLLIPAYTYNNGELEEAETRRNLERNNARCRFQRMVEHGRQPDAFVQEMLIPTEENENPLMPVFSSLPIREYRKSYP